mmetsp:Transcript_10650/g.33385  ORF Transcript_10650/g.33385 Transcript_10650/m.33385 type:complete len:322 (+) Transcript_10650:351-1316(+)
MVSAQGGQGLPCQANPTAKGYRRRCRQHGDAACRRQGPRMQQRRPRGGRPRPRARRSVAARSTAGSRRVRPEGARHAHATRDARKRRGCCDGIHVVDLPLPGVDVGELPEVRGQRNILAVLLAIVFFRPPLRLRASPPLRARLLGPHPEILALPEEARAHALDVVLALPHAPDVEARRDLQVEGHELLQKCNVHRVLRVRLVEEGRQRESLVLPRSGQPTDRRGTEATSTAHGLLAAAEATRREQPVGPTAEQWAAAAGHQFAEAARAAQGADAEAQVGHRLLRQQPRPAAKQRSGRNERAWSGGRGRQSAVVPMEAWQAR